MNEILPARNSHNQDMTLVETSQFISVAVAGQLFGLPVLEVRDILSAQGIARIPLAPPEVAGALNLRGRIVTAIDFRRRINLPPLDPKEGMGMNVVVNHHGELYSLVIDSVGEVLSLPVSAREKVPETLDPKWREIASCVYRLEKTLMIILDIAQLLRFESTKIT